MQPVREIEVIAYYAMILLGILTLTGVFVAFYQAYREASWRRFFVSLFLFFFGIALPICAFVAAVAFTPDWKGGCKFGWIDCFYVGKLALLPLVLWASCSLYAHEIDRTQDRPWIVLGILNGAIVSTVCFVFGVIIQGIDPEICAFPLVQLYISVWYCIRAWQLLRVSKTTFKRIAKALLSCSPLWIIAAIWARMFYQSLPDTPPPGCCFVVTAAMQGHERVVGPRVKVEHRGQDCEANRQLATLWQFEELWANRAPRFHAGFRRVYNVIGPMVAARITSPYLADLTYLAIKPAEVLARIILKSQQAKQARQ